MQALSASLRSLQLEMEDKKDRLQKLNQAVESAKYFTRLADMATNKKKLEDEREQLNTELQSLTAQADTRARLQLKRGEAKTKRTEAQTKCVAFKMRVLGLSNSYN